MFIICDVNVCSLFENSELNDYLFICCYEFKFIGNLFVVVCCVLFFFGKCKNVVLVFFRRFF